MVVAVQRPPRLEETPRRFRSSAMAWVPLPESIEEKKTLVLSQEIALWDAIEECDIIGASDSSVKNVVPTKIPELLKQTQVERILCNGALSKKIYDKFQLEQTGIPAVQMPSTSPANAAWSLEKLVEEWKIISVYMKK